MMPALARQALRVLVPLLLAVAPLSAGINRWSRPRPALSIRRALRARRARRLLLSEVGELSYN